MKFFAIFSLLAALTTATPIPEAEAGAPPIQVRSVTYGGSGCPQGQAVQAADVDNGVSIRTERNSLSVSLMTDEFYAHGGGVDSRKFCQINLQLDYPGDYQYAITGATFTGDVSVPSGSAAFQRGIYYFAGETGQGQTESAFAGPIRERYTLRESVAGPWSPCGRQVALNVNSAVRVDGSGNISGSVDGKYTLGLGLQWRRCR